MAAPKLFLNDSHATANVSLLTPQQKWPTTLTMGKENVRHAAQ